MLRESISNRERRSVEKALKKANPPIDKDLLTSSYIADFFLEGKMISEYALHDRFVLKMESVRFLGITPNKAQKQRW